MEPVPSCQSRKNFSVHSRLLISFMLFSFPVLTSSYPTLDNKATARKSGSDFVILRQTQIFVQRLQRPLV
jgi:hypothetical protein